MYRSTRPGSVRGGVYMPGEEHEDNTVEREVMPRLPTSGQILGALVMRLGISLPAHQQRNARRYFAADPEHLVKDATRAEIIDAIAEALAGAGFVSSPQTGESNHEAAPALSATLQWHADHWDLLRSSVRRRTESVVPSRLPKVWEVFVRLAVIDLALRVAAHLHLAGTSSRGAGAARLGDCRCPRRVSQPEAPADSPYAGGPRRDPRCDRQYRGRLDVRRRPAVQ